MTNSDIILTTVILTSRKTNGDVLATRCIDTSRLTESNVIATFYIVKCVSTNSDVIALTRGDTCSPQCLLTNSNISFVVFSTCGSKNTRLNYNETKRTSKTQSRITGDIDGIMLCGQKTYIVSAFYSELSALQFLQETF